MDIGKCARCETEQHLTVMGRSVEDMLCSNCAGKKIRVLIAKLASVTADWEEVKVHRDILLDKLADAQSVARELANTWKDPKESPSANPANFKKLEGLIEKTLAYPAAGEAENKGTP